MQFIEPLKAPSGRVWINLIQLLRFILSIPVSKISYGLWCSRRIVAFRAHSVSSRLSWSSNRTDRQLNHLTSSAAISLSKLPIRVPGSLDLWFILFVRKCHFLDVKRQCRRYKVKVTKFIWILVIIYQLHNLLSLNYSEIVRENLNNQNVLKALVSC